MLYARPGLGPTVRADCADWQPLVDHLTAVSNLCRDLARSCSPDVSLQANAAAMGFLHDVGKARPEWQAMLKDSAIRGVHRRVPHAIHGAVVALGHGWLDAAFAIAGHHAGMPDHQGPASLTERCSEHASGAREALAQLEGECRERNVDLDTYLAGAAAPDSRLRSRVRLDLRVRMLASILVDADRTNSASRATSYAHRTLSRAPSMLERLEAEVATRSARTGVASVRYARMDVFNRCRDAAMWDERILTLNAPTGSGKTLATLAFGLARAAARPNEARRLVIVLPYLSIIEQNARDIASIVGEDEVLEHHSGNLVSAADSEGFSERDESRRSLTENWNSPIVITTSVRFFESLFSNHPSDLRRLHSVANAVVVFDEVQTLPRHYLLPMWSALRGLASDFGTTILLSSATLPDFDTAVRPIERSLPVQGMDRPREIVSDRSQLHRALQRVRVDWPDRTQTVDEVAGEIARHDRVLVVVNLKRDARDLFEAVARVVGDRGLWHLSTNMCPAHRREVLAGIRDELKNGRRCRVISTQLVEAGVDLDFPVVFRAVAPLDSIAQAAGRCDREGRLTEAAGRPSGLVKVFDLGEDHDHRKGTSYWHGAATTRRHLRLIPKLDLSRPDVFDDYYREWYNCDGCLDLRDIQQKRRQLMLRRISEEFEFIDDPTRSVVVPYGDEGRALVARLREGIPPTIEQWRRLQQYAVGVYPAQLDALLGGGIAYQATPELDLYVVEPTTYHSKLGLVVPTDTSGALPVLEV